MPPMIQPDGLAMTHRASDKGSATINPFQQGHRAGLVTDQLGVLLLDPPDKSLQGWLSPQHCQVLFQTVAVDNPFTLPTCPPPAAWEKAGAQSFKTPNAAFYRGALPEVLMVTLNPSQIGAFVMGWVQLIDSLSTLGYLLDTDPQSGLSLAAIHPKVVVLGQGLMMASLLNRLDWQLERLPLNTPNPALIRQELLALFSRGVFPQGKILHLGGPEERVVRQVQGVFNRKTLPSTVEVTSPERLEMRQLADTLLRHTVPGLSASLSQSLGLSVAEAHRALCQTLMTIGQRRGSLHSGDLPAKPASGKLLKPSGVSPSEAASLQLLLSYLQQNELTDEGGVLGWLVEQSMTL